jgi:hypothetical protein
MHSTVNLTLVCKELKILLNDDEVSITDKVKASEAFKDALWKKLNFPVEVTKWDAEAVLLFINCIVEIG